MTDELKPCPFCPDGGDPALIVEINPDLDDTVRCDNCTTMATERVWSGPRPIEDALRAEVEMWKAAADEQCRGKMAFSAEVAALKAELEKFTEPLTEKQAGELLGNMAFFFAVDQEELPMIDAAIREVRKGKNDANSL